MECSWKTVLLLVCASLGVQYTAIRTLRDTLSGPCQGVYHCQSQHHRESNWRTLCVESWTFTEAPRKHILLFATTRSGSSFTGQLLNHHPEIFYMFEPLYHVQQAFTNSSGRLRRSLDRRALLGAYRDLLLNLYNCDLHFMESYIRPEPQDHVTNSFFRRSSSHALCSPPVCLDGEDGIVLDPPEETRCPKKCGALNLTLASASCLSRGHVAIKTVRIPEVGDLRTLAEDPRLDLKIIHLVRDPRAILASRMMAFSDQFRAWKIWNATGRQPRYVDLSQITSTCKDMLASAETGLQKPSWLQGRYLLVRYEDLAFNPQRKAAELYQFVGLEMEDRVQMWITKNTNSNLSAPTEWNYRYSTTRDSRVTAESWRLRLGFDIVRTVQNLCNKTLALLGYRLVHSAAQLRNLSHSLVETKTFQPSISQT
ncbi:carbohydrate sulfotransferase 1-like [Dunckerocampus dactyliophorus]|uniref:carbohydrate sulfotransferase 1-like n=1 Tax=Dunckerocampus dactyliophorus TaxID=161453 RepID=UPI002406E7B9|nr:carbohydrate sulfotransferase 1-like [Dunckerocampus dactyliophorus]